MAAGAVISRAAAVAASSVLRDGHAVNVFMVFPQRVLVRLIRTGGIIANDAARV
jgi:hypothetical protein